MASQKTPLGLILPIQGGNSGFFESAYDSFTQKRMNIINLLRTRIGERRMQPLFGTRLWNVTFSQNTEILPDVVRNIINEDVSKWIEGVEIEDIKVSTQDSNMKDVRDENILLIQVIFRDITTQQQGTVDIYINSGKI